MSELPYVELSIFNEKVNEFAKTNFVLKNLFNNPRSDVKSWEDLPPHLKADLFKKVGCKPSIKNINMSENIQLPRSYYQPLFDLLHQKHGITPLESEMVNIIHVVERMQGKQQGAVWVKASSINIEYRKTYYAQWPSGTVIKSTGWFQESDGTFFWNENGYVPVLKNERHMLLILDESGTPATGIENPTLTQERADFIREVNDRDMEGMEAIEFAEWFWGYCKEYHRGGTYVTNLNEVMTVKELYKLFKQQKDNP